MKTLVRSIILLREQGIASAPKHNIGYCQCLMLIDCSAITGSIDFCTSCMIDTLSKLIRVAAVTSVEPKSIVDLLDDGQMH